MSEDYERIYEKYQRRINTFRERIKNSTVFVRCILNQKEIEYINENWKYINKIVKMNNERNMIIYVYRNGLTGITNEIVSYKLDIDEYSSEVYEMRHMFDSSVELINLCEHLIDEKTLHKNLTFEKMKTYCKQLPDIFINVHRKILKE